MNKSMLKALPFAATLLMACGGVASAQTVMLTGQFAAEGAATTQATGDVAATLDTVTHKLSYTIHYAGLSGPVTVAHFHGPAKPGVSAGVLQPIAGPFQSGMTATGTVSADTQKALLANLTYVNLHTTAYPKGEARAQMIVKP